jgi:hypothetical protein
MLYPLFMHPNLHGNTMKGEISLVKFPENSVFYQFPHNVSIASRVYLRKASSMLSGTLNLPPGFPDCPGRKPFCGGAIGFIASQIITPLWAFLKKLLVRDVIGCLALQNM